MIVHNYLEEQKEAEDISTQPFHYSSINGNFWFSDSQPYSGLKTWVIESNHLGLVHIKAAAKDIEHNL